MQFLKTSLPGAYVIHNEIFYDERGSFLKTFHSDIFENFGLETNFQECFYSKSKKNVIRGMHFQTPPYDHHKIVYPVDGEILDVVLDLRKDSPSYKQTFSVNLNSSDGKAVYVPPGLAHGFASLSENAIVMYMTSTVYSRHYDRGIRWNSFGFDWNINNPVISSRDKNFKTLEEFDSPF